MKTATQKDAEHIWQILVTLVVETRGDWKRKVTEATGLSFSRVQAPKRLKHEPLTDRSERRRVLHPNDG
jgi:hypothetical protein